MHIAPENAEGIVLIIEMIFSAVKNQAVWIVVPPSPRRGVELIAVGLRVIGGRKRIASRADLDALKCCPQRVWHFLAINRRKRDLLSPQSVTVQRICRQPKGVGGLRQRDGKTLHQIAAIINSEHHEVGRVFGEGFAVLAVGDRHDEMSAFYNEHLFQGHQRRRRCNVGVGLRARFSGAQRGQRHQHQNGNKCKYAFVYLRHRLLF